MGQGEPDEGCLHVPHVAPGLVCDLQDAGEFVTLTSGEQSEVASCLGCTRIEGLPGTRPDAAQLPKEEPDRYRSPPRKVVQEGDEGSGVGQATTDPGDVTGMAVRYHLGQRLEARGCPEVVSGITPGVEQRHE
jgi:hypothetical protein